MNLCPKILRQLEAYALGSLSAASAASVAAHLDECASCRRHFEKIADLIRQLAFESRQRALASPVQARDILSLAADRENEDRLSFDSARKRLLRRLALAASLLALLGGAGLLAIKTTPHYGVGDELQVAWAQFGTAPLPDSTLWHPVVFDNDVYAILHDAKGSHIARFDRESGIRHWQAPLRSAGPLAADECHVYVRESDPAALLALDVASGRTVWRRPLAADSQQPLRPTPAPPALLGDSLYWSHGARIDGARKDSGTPLWSVSPDGRRVLGLAADGAGTIYAFSDRSYWAMDAANGSLLWLHDHARPLSSVYNSSAFIACDGDSVFLAGSAMVAQGALAAFDARTGLIRWQRETGAPLSLQALHGRVYLKSHHLEALAADTGEPIWTAKAEGCSPVSEAHGLVFFVGGIRKRKVFAFDYRSGERILERQLSGSCGGLTLKDGWGYYNGHDGALYALRFAQRSG